MEACFGRRLIGSGLGRRNRHQRAAIRGAAGGRSPRLNVERVEAPGVLECMKAVVTHAPQKCGVGVEQAIEPVDQDARRQKIKQRPVAAAVALRRRFGRGEPARLLVAGGLFRGLRFRSPGRLAGDGVDRLVGAGRRRQHGLAPLKPLRQLARQFIEGAVFHRRKRRRSRIADRAKWHHIRRRFHGRVRIRRL